MPRFLVATAGAVRGGHAQESRAPPWAAKRPDPVALESRGERRALPQEELIDQGAGGAELLDVALAQLPDELQDRIHLLRVREDMSMAAIAELRGLPPRHGLAVPRFGRRAREQFETIAARLAARRGGAS